jgi:glutaconate CoA-transferase, subunit B
MYVPRHSRVTFVAQLDFLSGMGHHPARRRGAGVRYLISDLGQFDWTEGRMRLTTYHRGTTVEHIQAKTGFALDIAPDVHETPAPSVEELRLLREVIDPLDVRKLETLGGSARRDLLRQILEKEGAL